MAYMLGWEFLFRGFLLFGLAGSEKPVPTRRLVGAVAFSTLLFGLSHLGKPLPEVVGSFCAGVILCAIAWTTQSVLAPVLLHTIVFGMFTAQVAWLNR
jgi:membrane protease YdiL (CAAX protease family)